jgi:hypothetical protein
MFKKMKNEINLTDYKIPGTGKYVKAKMMNFNARGVLYPSRKKLNVERSLNIRRRKVRVQQSSHQKHRKCNNKTTNNFYPTIRKKSSKPR